MSSTIADPNRDQQLMGVRILNTGLNNFMAVNPAPGRNVDKRTGIRAADIHGVTGLAVSLHPPHRVGGAGGCGGQ